MVVSGDGILIHWGVPGLAILKDFSVFAHVFPDRQEPIRMKNVI